MFKREGRVIQIPQHLKRLAGQIKKDPVSFRKEVGEVHYAFLMNRLGIPIEKESNITAKCAEDTRVFSSPADLLSKIARQD